MNIKPFFSLYLCLVSALNVLGQSAHPSDSMQLVLLYNETGGPNWNNTWDLTQPVIGWYGITMDTTTGRVQKISLSLNNLTDTIPDLALPKLEMIEIEGNDIDGPLPAFSSIPEIFSIELTGNGITGPLPDFSNCPQLSILEALHNKIDGPLPDFSGCPNLTRIFLSNNELSGNIPNFPNSLLLDRITLTDNQLSDTIPDLSHLGSLRILQLEGNNLEGRIPDLQNPELIIFTINENQLSGTIPQLSGLISLEILDLERNHLQGTVPNFNLPKLERLDLFMNELDSVPAFDAMPLVEFINLSQNPLKPGPLPDFSLPQLERLDAINTNLSGPLTSLPGCPFLNTLLVMDNQLEGVVPDFSDNPFLQDLRFSRNQLTSCPSLTALPVLSTLFMDQNRFTFEDILPNITAATGAFVYWTQAVIDPLDNLIVAAVGDSVELHMPIDSQLTDNEYIWFHNGTAFDTVNSNSLWLSHLTDANSGIYSCQARNPGANNLTLILDTIQLVVERSNLIEILEQTAIQQFPNPATDFLNLSLDDSLPMPADGWTVRIIDLQGRLVMEQFQLKQQRIRLDVQHLSPACYVVELLGGGKHWSQSWIKS
ncbi:MAG: T9SS type A sorting domain-containing protein [Bacteroidota bacterium]